jgi:hypothetical protein
MPGSKTKGVTDFFLLQTGPITIIELLPWSLKFFVHKHVPKNICLLLKKSFSFDIVNLLKNVLETQIVATKIQVLSVYYLIGV